MSDIDNGAGAGGDPFSALLGDIGGLAKALPAAEGPAAAVEGDADDPDALGPDGKRKVPVAAAASGEMVKSFKFVDASGKEHEAVDGADLVKSLIDRIDANEAGTVKVLQAASAQLSAQSSMIKSLSETLAVVSAGGVGRKATLAINERPASDTPLNKSQAAGDGQIGSEEFLAKALQAQSLGAINGVQVSECEVHINQGRNPPPHLVKAVLDATTGK